MAFIMTNLQKPHFNVNLIKWRKAEHANKCD